MHAGIFWHLPKPVGNFLVEILNAYYTFLSTLDYKFLFNYDEVMPLQLDCL